MSNQQGVTVELRDLSIRAGEQPLLRNASTQFEAGKITLIVGRSGVGKSILLRTIAGILDPRETSIHTTGKVVFHASDAAQPVRRHSVGVVFQDFALFDELTPLQNVKLASDHRRNTVHGHEQLTPEGLLTDLDVPRNVRTAALSGGERQRLAVARTLANDPDVMLYDEPTSGLDIATAQEVTRLIKATHAHHPRTSIIVTHDYQMLAKIADEIFFYDPATQALLQIPPASWSHIDELLTDPPPIKVASDLAAQKSTWHSFLGRCVTRLARFLDNSSRAIEGCLEVPFRLLPICSRPRWAWRFFLHYLRAVSGVSACVYIAIAGMIVGFVTTYFTFRFLPYANYTKPLLIQDLLRTVGFTLYRVFVPILATILVAARCGAAVASDVGGKKYGQQLDALRTLGVEPRRYLLTSILYAFLLGTPCLVAISYAAAAITSLVVFTATHVEQGPWFWRLHFHQELVLPDQWFYAGSGWLLAKTLLSAIGIAMIAYTQGARPKHSSRAVSQGITSTILWSTLFVLAIHFLFAFFEFEKYYHG